jgi:aryl-alcohol dehydrogenase-like predicted oxidoreductase
LIPTQPFGRTGHQSTRVLFGAAALAQSTEEKTARALELLLEHGINHIDVAASYGDAELWVGGWMREHRDRFFLATKTGQRSHQEARAEIRRSLERLRVNRVDLIQLHHLVEPDDWEQVFSEEGALRACVEAREEGLVRFIGVTGHGTRVAARHRASLERFDFDSVLLPYNYPQARDDDYGRDFEELAALCEQRGVAMQTIKSIARRRWREGVEPSRTTWYEPLEDQDDIDAAVGWALSRPGIFVNSASDLVLLRRMISAAERWAGDEARAEPTAIETVAREREMAPLFVRDFQSV